MTAGFPTPPISPLPATAEFPPAIAAVEVTPPPGRYPHAATAGQPFEIGVRAFAPDGTGELQGVLRWRRVLAPRWREEPLQALGGNAFAIRWAPPEAGNYEWCVELWAGDDGADRRGSSGDEVLHLLRATRGELAGARWRAAARLPLARLHPAPGGDTDVLLLAPIFPLDADGRVGRAGAGHYTIDPALGDSRAFGELSAAAGRAGVSLALTVPLDCSPQHPLRQGHPDAFRADGTPDWTGGGWRALWEAWEAVFRFWIVQGIDLFHLPHPTSAPVSFWENVLGRLREDFPDTVFTTTPEQTEAAGEHLLGVGFMPLPAECVPPESPAATVIATPAPGSAPGAPLPPEDDAATELETEDRAAPGVECFCSNTALAAKLLRGGGGLVLQIENRDPSAAQSGHVHFDDRLLELSEHELYYLRDLANGRAYRWSGTTNFLALAAGETAKTFRIERS